MSTASSPPISGEMQLTPSVSVKVTVSGPQRNMVVVSIKDGSMEMWSHTLMQTMPDAEVPSPLQIGNVTIDGGEFHLQVPTSAQPGMVMFRCTIKTPTNPDGQPFSAPVYTWQLQ